MNIKLIAVLVVLVLTLVTVLQNTAVVTLRFLFWERSMSQIAVLLLTLFTGFVLGLLVASLGRRSR